MMNSGNWGTFQNAKGRQTNNKQQQKPSQQQPKLKERPSKTIDDELDLSNYGYGSLQPPHEPPHHIPLQQQQMKAYPPPPYPPQQQQPQSGFGPPPTYGQQQQYSQPPQSHQMNHQNNFNNNPPGPMVQGPRPPQPPPGPPPKVYPPLQPPPPPPDFPWKLDIPPLENFSIDLVGPVQTTKLQELSKATPVTTSSNSWMNSSQGPNLLLYEDIIDQSLPDNLRRMFQPLYCKLCTLNLTSTIVARDHYKGKRHVKKVEEWLEENVDPLEFIPGYIRAVGDPESTQTVKSDSTVVTSHVKPPINSPLSSSSDPSQSSGSSFQIFDSSPQIPAQNNPNSQNSNPFAFNNTSNYANQMDNPWSVPNQQGNPFQQQQQTQPQMLQRPQNQSQQRLQADNEAPLFQTMTKSFLNSNNKPKQPQNPFQINTSHQMSLNSNQGGPTPLLQTRIPHPNEQNNSWSGSEHSQGPSQGQGSHGQRFPKKIDTNNPNFMPVGPRFGQPRAPQGQNPFEFNGGSNKGFQNRVQPPPPPPPPNDDEIVTISRKRPFASGLRNLSHGPQSLDFPQFQGSGPQEGSEDPIPAKQVTIFCHICNVKLGSQFNADQHFNGKNHKARLMGEPPPNPPRARKRNKPPEDLHQS